MGQFFYSTPGMMPHFVDGPSEPEPERLDVSNKTLDEIRELVAADKTAAKFEGEVSIEWGPVCARLLEMVDEARPRANPHYAFVRELQGRNAELTGELEKTKAYLANVREDRNRLVRGDLNAGSFLELVRVRKERDELRAELADVRDRLECANQLCEVHRASIEELAAQRDKLKHRLDNGEPWPFNVMARQFGPELESTKAELKNVRKELGKSNKKIQSQSAEIKRLTENAHERDCKINKMYAERNELKRELKEERARKRVGWTTLEVGPADSPSVHDREGDPATVTVEGFTTRCVSLRVRDGLKNVCVQWYADPTDARKLGRLLLGAADTAEGI